MATEGTGTRLPSTNPTERVAGPNGLKLSDSGWRGQARSTGKGRPPASVRWSAWLGTGPLTSSLRESLLDGGEDLTIAAATVLTQPWQHTLGCEATLL